jgi:integrase
VRDTRASPGRESFLAKAVNPVLQDGPRGGSGVIPDRSNTATDLRDALDPLSFDWVTSHTFRKTAATLLDESGLSVRETADQLGHPKRQHDLKRALRTPSGHPASRSRTRRQWKRQRRRARG